MVDKARKLLLGVADWICIIAQISIVIILMIVMYALGIVSAKTKK